MLKAIPAAHFFSQRPPHIPVDGEHPDFDTLCERVRSLSGSDRSLDAVKAVLLRENIRLGAGETAEKALKSIERGTVFVISGQQAGLFGGPLYTLYKALHTVRLASILTGHTGIRVIPLFWVASDDHDFEEVCHLGVRTDDGSPRRISYTPSAYLPGSPVGSIVIDEGIGETIDSFGVYGHQGGYAEEYLTVIRESWQPGSRWPDAFSRQILRLFTGHELAIIDPRWEGIKGLFGSVMAAELDDPLASAKLINETADVFETANLRKKALRKPAGSTNLFLETGGIRHPLIFENRGFQAGETLYSKRELRDILDSEPWRFSPAAGLRPVCQDTLLPVAATIAGPGERRYLEQIKPVYNLFGVDRSMIWPRASFTIIDARALRVSEKEQVALDGLFRTPEHITSGRAQQSFPAEIQDKFDALERSIGAGFEDLAESIITLDPSLKPSILKDRGRVLHTIQNIRQRAVRAHKKTQDISEKRFASVTGFLMPGNGIQERWFGIDAVLPILGGGGFDELLSLTSPGEEYHRIVLPG